MKTNEYLQKYGQKALQVYKKTLRNTGEELGESQNNLIPPRLKSKHKSSSSKSLHKFKPKTNVTQDNNFTFNKPMFEKKHRKLMISGLSTPKNKSTRPTFTNHEKGRSSSTKKKGAHHKVTEKIQQALGKHKSLKSLAKTVIQCLDLMAQEQTKICKWVGQLKDIFCNISNEAISYRKKWKQQVSNSKKMQKEIEQLQAGLKTNLDKKRKPVEVMIMEQNQKLRTQIDRLEQKVNNFQRKQMVFITAIEQMKNRSISDSAHRETYEEAPSKFKKQFYGHLQRPGSSGYEESQEQSQIQR